VYKNLKSEFLERHANYNKHFENANWPEALDELIYILDLAEKHKKAVVKGKFLGTFHSVLLTACIEISYVINRQVNVEKLLKQFDEILPNSINEQCFVMIDKTVAYSVYALSINSPQIAIPELIKQELFYKENNYSKAENFFPYRYYVFVFFACKDWKKCIEYINIVNEMGGSEWYNSILYIVRLICIYEQGELQYFNSLMDQFKNKRRKNGIKIKDTPDLTSSAFHILNTMTNRVKIDLTDQFNNMLVSYSRDKRGVRYIIHWIASQFPALLNGKDYRTFLDQQHFEHFDFNEVQNDTDVKKVVNY